jgi:hypothetical protein
MSLSAVAKYALAVKRLQDLAAALRATADGEFVKAANDRIQARMEKIVSDKLPKHKQSGFALAVVDVYPDAHGIGMKQPRYLRYQREPRKPAKARAPKKRVAVRRWPHVKLVAKAKGGKRQNWWPFARGVPPFILQQAAKIYAEELQKLLKR